MLRVYNTLTRQIEPFKPCKGRRVQMYTCGPSVYRQPHIGNYRTFLFEDVLQRYLEYSGYNVVRLMTFTDIEDKSIAEAEEAEVSVKELTQKNVDTFFVDANLLRMKTPHYAPRSSTTVDQAAKLIKALVEKRYAYWHRHEGGQNVYFDPLKFEDFGKLSHLNMSKWPRRKRRFHRDTYPGTPWNRGDFILWHGYKEGDTVCWDTDIGKGRPAWNVQDAAMVTKHLGFTIDIACGGVDNLVRHHDYTIAVAEGASGKEFAHYWFHGEHLFVDGKKMSKSKGNVHYPADLTKMGYKGEHVRFFLLYGHYRRPLNFTFEKFKKASQKLDVFKNMVDNFQKVNSAESSKSAEELVDRLVTGFEENMDNDLDVKDAFNDLFRTLSELDNVRNRGKLSRKDACTAVANLQKVDGVLQIFF